MIEYKEGWWYMGLRLWHDSVQEFPMRYHNGYMKSIYDGRPIKADKTFAPATLDDLSVDLGGDKCWFVEQKWAGEELCICLWRDLDTMKVISRDSKHGNDMHVGREIASRCGAPIINYEQWRELTNGKC